MVVVTTRARRQNRYPDASYLLVHMILVRSENLHNQPQPFCHGASCVLRIDAAARTAVVVLLTCSDIWRALVSGNIRLQLSTRIVHAMAHRTTGW